MINIEVPPTLRDYCNHHDDILVSANSVASALAELKKSYPAVFQCVCDETGMVRRHIHLFINSQFVSPRDSKALEATLELGDVLTIWTAVSGG